MRTSLAFAFAALCRASIIAASNFTLCTNETECAPRLVVTLSVESGATAGAESVEFALQNSTDSEGNTYNSTAPIRLTLSKTRPRTTYRLRYIQSFSSQLAERVLMTAFPLCSEGLLNANGQLRVDSTCGYARQNGSPVAFSGGFCCSCSALSFFTGLSSNPNRGGCAALTPQQTAHCLQTVGTLWAAYEVIDSRVNYTIELSLTGVAANGTALAFNATLSPDSPRVSLPGLSARLAGDLAPSVAMSTLGALAVLGPEASAVSAQWLAVGREMLSLDGRDCNRIGTSFAAFHNQPRRCEVPRGSCLGGQIEELLARDRAAVAAGRAPSFLLSRFGAFSGGAAAQLQSDYAETFTSIVGVEIAAASFAFRTNAGRARIAAANATSFAADVASGELRAEVVSLSAFAADFTLSARCDGVALSSAAARLSLPPFAAAARVFRLSARDGGARAFECALRLENERGAFLDAATVRGNVGARPSISAPQSPLSSGAFGFSTNGAALTVASAAVCAAVCPRSFSLVCLAFARCAQMVSVGFYFCAIAAAALFIALIFCFCRKRR